MARLQRECFFGQLHRGLGIPFDQLLLHDPLHTDKTRAVVRKQTLVCGFSPHPVPGLLSRLSGQKRGPVEIAVSLFRLRQRHAAIARSQRHHTFGQRVEALAFAVAREVPRNRGFVAIQKAQERHDQPDNFQQNPDRKNQNQKANDRFKRSKRELGVGNRNPDAAVGLQQKTCTPGSRCHQRNEEDDFQK